MRNFSSNLLFLSVISLSFAACAGIKSGHHSKKYFIINDATIQRTIPGIRQGSITTQYRFVITWNSNEQPASFFWKSTDAWMNCKVYKLHNIKDNNGEEVKFDEIKKGDILSLAPFKGGKFPIPPLKDETINNVIIFKTIKSKWQSVKISDLRKLPDLILP